jgi:hypothetical protein
MHRSGDCIGTDIECVDLGKLDYPVFNPATAVFVVVTGVLVKAAQKGAADAPGGAVVKGCRLQGDLAFP